MLDFHLASLYNVSTKRLKEQVRRNIRRFPSDFMFELTLEEYLDLRSQFASSVVSKGGRRYMPFAFTEQGVAMLSSVLKSDRAIVVNIEIMRAFVSLREILLTNKNIASRLDAMQKKYDLNFQLVFNAINEFSTLPDVPRRRIGFQVQEPQAIYKVKKKK
ncbi:MAG: ORF6N domain-containing protein [Bacteroidota bacterium]|nr:ORF6N domain-containing protein [Bacteroidota bacterium]